MPPKQMQLTGTMKAQLLDEQTGLPTGEEVNVYFGSLDGWRVTADRLSCRDGAWTVLIAECLD